jgi:hypothetical protein
VSFEKATEEGIERIAAERQRQIEAEGYSAEHDDAYVECELSEAAMHYVRAAQRRIDHPLIPLPPAPLLWPWKEEAWKPSDNPIRNLEKAGALIAAEIDRLLRLARKQRAQSGEVSHQTPWPTTVDAAAREVVLNMDFIDKKEVASTKEDDLPRFHHSLGRNIRNNLGLWRGNAALLAATGKEHPDDASGVVIRAVWQRLRTERWHERVTKHLVFEDASDGHIVVSFVYRGDVGKEGEEFVHELGRYDSQEMLDRFLSAMRMMSGGLLYDSLEDRRHK